MNKWNNFMYTYGKKVTKNLLNNSTAKTTHSQALNTVPSIQAAQTRRK